MSKPKDPIDEFSRRRDALRHDKRPVPLDASNIDDMLDALDRVLNDEATLANEELEEPAPILETVRVILEELAESCNRLEAAAVSANDQLVQDFVGLLRPRLRLLIRRASETGTPAAGPIEIELDYEGLREFMMYPDIDRLAS